MNSPDIEKILTRIQKMLAMANDKANIHESATAAAMAERLMRKYQIEMADVLAHGPSAFSARDVNEEYEWVGNTPPLYAQHIATGCATANECHVRYQGRDINRGLLFVGVGPDPTVAAEMYRYLVNEVKRLCKLAKLPRSAQASFRSGAGSELHARLKDLAEERKRQFAEASSGTALVLHKASLIQEAYGNFSYKSSTHSARDHQAYHQGKQAAKGINLSEQITGNGTQEKLT